MPTSDIMLVFQWWGTLFLVGAAAYPLTQYFFRDWFDRGYLFTKAVGCAVVTYGIYLLGTLHVLPFTSASVWIILGTMFLLGIPLHLRMKEHPSFRQALVFVGEELFFFAALLLWTWVKGHEPSIHNLEKYMDFGFTKSILDSRYFPVSDMWYAGHTINYYYFGHTVMAALTRLSGIDLTYTFNLMLATLFAFTLTMSFSIGVQLVRLKSKVKVAAQVGSGILTALLVTIVGNMQTIYAFTRGYTGDAVKPFWQLFWPLTDFWKDLPQGLNTYWYANATRFIPYTIHEFPSYSFVVSDVHGHVLSLPFTLLAIALFLVITQGIWTTGKTKGLAPYIFYGFLCGVLLMTNALDGPIYIGLLIVTLAIFNFQFSIFNWRKYWLICVSVVCAAAVTSLPFLLHFKSFVNGIAVNCPPDLFANTHVGPLIFEGTEKCQHSAFWMWWLLWGFFIFCGLFLALPMFNRMRLHKKVLSHELMLAVAFVFFVLLLIFPEFFYFKDIYPMHFRANTMFKLGYQAFIMLSIVSGYVIATMRGRLFPKFVKMMFYVLLVPQMVLIMIYPIFSVRSGFNSLSHYTGIFGMGWFQEQYSDDWAGISWMNQNAVCKVTDVTCVNPVILEADGDSYTDYNRYSAFTGLPTVVGWAVHEWLWRGSYDVVAPRRTEVQEMYTSPDINVTRRLLAKYHITYVIVGILERNKYSTIQEEKFSQIGEPVFTRGQTTIYKIH